jgi:hypothetical protein
MSFLARLWRGWKRVAHKIGDFQARLILVLFYFVILAPFSLLVKRSDPLGIRKKALRGWQQRDTDTVPPLQKIVRQW